MLIVLTGIDGSGKSTAARALVDAVRAEGGDGLVLSNHAGRRRMSLLSARLGFQLPPTLADAIETAIRVCNVLVSHSRARRFQGLVVMDRHLHCQLALRHTRAIPRGWFLPWLLSALPTPDLVVHLDVDPCVAHQRILARGTDEESVEDLTAFRNAYRSLPEYQEFVQVNAEGSTDEVLARVREVVGAGRLDAVV